MLDATVLSLAIVVICVAVAAFDSSVHPPEDED